MNKKAIDIYLAAFDGNQAAAARAIGVSQQLFHYWMTRSKRKDIPGDYIPAAARAIGKPPKYLRPDFE